MPPPMLLPGQLQPMPSMPEPLLPIYAVPTVPSGKLTQPPPISEPAVPPPPPPKAGDVYWPSAEPMPAPFIPSAEPTADSDWPS